MYCSAQQRTSTRLGGRTSMTTPTLGSSNSVEQVLVSPSEVSALVVSVAARFFGATQSNEVVCMPAANPSAVSESRADAYDRRLMAPMSQTAATELRRRLESGQLSRRKVRSTG